MIQVKNITFGHTGEELYQDASFSLPKNKKAGLVGLNGAGKSTLFSLLIEDEWPDDGKIVTQGSIVLVPQEVKRDPIQQKATSVRDYLNSAKAHKDHVWETMLSNMEMGDLSLDAVPKKLSGGQKTKLALLRAIMLEPDILLLDEPTNFLDTAGKKWVMHFLSQYKKSLLVVSHDLDLLDRHIDKIIYINKNTKQFEEYTGNYSKFKKLKAEKDAHLTRFIKNQEQKIKRLKTSVDKLKRSNVETVIRQRVLLEKRIEKMESSLPQLPKEIVRIKLDLPTPARIGELPLWVKSLKKSYGDTSILNDISFSVQRGQRIALMGRNGSGKSTLIKTILGFIDADDGQVELDTQAKVGYYSQEFETFDLDAQLYEYVRKMTHASESQIRTFLAKFMFGSDRLKQRLSSLSGGEKTRLSIALLMLKDYNLLVLDEPTTYLDVLSQAIILDALKSYRGTMVIVSHTPEFLAELKPDRALLLPEEEFVFWDNTLLERSGE